MGNTCKSMADSFQCMTKLTTIKKIKTKQQKKVAPPRDKNTSYLNVFPVLILIGLTKSISILFIFSK